MTKLNDEVRECVNRYINSNLITMEDKIAAIEQGKLFLVPFQVKDEASNEIEHTAQLFVIECMKKYVDIELGNSSVIDLPPDYMLSMPKISEYINKVKSDIIERGGLQAFIDYVKQTLEQKDETQQ